MILCDLLIYSHSYLVVSCTLSLSESLFSWILVSITSWAHCASILFDQLITCSLVMSPVSCVMVTFFIISAVIVSTAESIQLCYTNRYGVVVVVGVVVIVSMVNFFTFNVCIRFLPLVRIVWIKEHLITTDSYWRLQFRCWWWKKQIIL